MRYFLLTLNAAAWVLFVAIYYFWNYQSRKAALVALCVTAFSEVVIQRLVPERKAWFQRVSLLFLFLPIALSLPFLHLLATWNSGIGSYFYLGGIVPYSDAAGYYQGALAMIEHGTLNEYCLRKPLGPCLYGLMLLMTGQHLQLMLLLNTFMVGFSIFFSASAVVRSHGITAGSLFALGLFAYIAEYLPSVLLEPQGFTFANLGFALLWQAIGSREKRLWYAGVGMLSMGLAIRPGALIVPVAAALFSCFHFSRPGRSGWRIAAWSFGIILVVMMIPYLITTVIDPARYRHTNASLAYTLYGLAKGGEGWGAFGRDHPELAAARVGDAAQAKIAFREGTRIIREYPALCIKGIFVSYVHMVEKPLHWFGVLYPLINPLAGTVLFIGAFFVIMATALRRNRESLFLLACFLAVIAGMPVYVDVGNRVCAATQPLTIAIVAVGVSLAFRFALGPAGFSLRAPVRVRTYKRLLLAVSLGLSLLVLTAPVILLLRPFDSARAPVSRETGGYSTDSSVHLQFRVSKGSFVHLVSDSARVAYPDVRISGFLTWAPNPPFGVVKPGHYVASVYNMTTQKGFAYVALENDPAPYDGHIVHVSAEKAEDGEPGQHLYVGSIIRSFNFNNVQKGR